MKYKFNEVFQQNIDGSLTPIRVIRIGNAVLGPSVTFRPGAFFGGVNIFDFLECDIEANEESQFLDIKGFYQNHE